MNIQLKPTMEWIPYSQITGVTNIGNGGFGIIYKATWLQNRETVAIKKLNSNKYFKHFLNEVK